MPFTLLPSIELGVILTFILEYEFLQTDFSSLQAAGELENLNSATADSRNQVQQVLLFAMIPVVVAFSFIVFIFYRAKREAFFKQREAAFQLQLADVQMKALHAQMNPHFIFNCMNSIHHYMHRNDIKLAGEYLIKFSQLIRHVLEHSSSRTITLKDDLEALELYIQLEQLRMDHSFSYTLHVDAEIDHNKTEVPPLMIQPFVENAIWYGLNKRGTEGLLTVSVERANGELRCIIEDNGEGSTAKDNLDLSYVVKKSSLGMLLIEERLLVINSLYKSNASFSQYQIKDNDDQVQGTRIELKLPIL